MRGVGQGGSRGRAAVRRLDKTVPFIIGTPRVHVIEYRIYTEAVLWQQLGEGTGVPIHKHKSGYHLPPPTNCDLPERATDD